MPSSDASTGMALSVSSGGALVQLSILLLAVKVKYVCLFSRRKELALRIAKWGIDAAIDFALRHIG